MKQRLVIGNWKMNKTVQETIRLITELKGLLSGKQDVEIVVAPPFTSLHPAEIAIQGTPIRLAAQNCYSEEGGAFTGEVSAPMLADIGCAYVILGHSERRTHLAESNQLINKKMRTVLDHEMKPVLCIGETKAEREASKTFDVLERQLRECLRGISDLDSESVVIAYEPVWAIGTGDAATPGTAQEVHQFIRDKFGAIFRKDVAQKIRILYGGSVTLDNVKGFMTQVDVDGALVGGASLDAKSFAAIAQFGE